jgi:catechol 2,3-dioxygenase-like lactoylglutathione lyase family enzyme
MTLHGITRIVTSLARSKQFYEEVLGFEPDVFYEPTNWQSYKCQEGVFFAIGEEPGSTNEVSFVVADVETLWQNVKDRADVVSPLEKTPWGTYRFVIRDPDGHLLAFGQKPDG